MQTKEFAEIFERVAESCSQVIVGKKKEIGLVLVSFLCSGHVLLEDLPGTGKTMLLRAFAKALSGDFKRIQFTPDLLPSDVTGIHFYDQKAGEFRFRPGPLFANLVLADEINRATPRTQSSLLEAMEERQITIDGETRRLAEPFFVMATQNPVESYGTFPLPEAQLDRFTMRLSLGYMTREQEAAVVSGESALKKLESVEPAASGEEISNMKEHIGKIAVQPDVLGYLMDIVELTRNQGDIAAGVSTRGAIALYRASQAAAAAAGRDFVIPEDVKELAPYVLAHRLVMKGRSSAREAERFFRELLEKVEVPLEKPV